MIGSSEAPIGYVCYKPDYSNAALDFMQDANGIVLPFTEDCGSPYFMQDATHSSILKPFKKKEGWIWTLATNSCSI